MRDGWMARRRRVGRRYFAMMAWILNVEER